MVSSIGLSSQPNPKKPATKQPAFGQNSHKAYLAGSAAPKFGASSNDDSSTPKAESASSRTLFQRLKGMTSGIFPNSGAPPHSIQPTQAPLSGSDSIDLDDEFLSIAPENDLPGPMPGAFVTDPDPLQKALAERRELSSQIKARLDKHSSNTERNANVASNIAKFAMNRQGDEQELYIHRAVTNYLEKLAEKESQDFSNINAIKNPPLTPDQILAPRPLKKAPTAKSEEQNPSNKQSGIFSRIGNWFSSNKTAPAVVESSNSQSTTSPVTSPKVTIEEVEDVDTSKTKKGPLPEQQEAEVLELSEKTSNDVSPEPAENSDSTIKTPADSAQPTTKPEGSEKAEEAGKTGETKPAGKAKDSNQTNQTNDAKKNENEEGGGILKGWKKTKLFTGAGLLAGGIALKMTLIGIVPGLIMAGAGAAVMGWGLLNYIFNGKKDDAKTEGEQKASTTNNS